MYSWHNMWSFWNRYSLGHVVDRISPTVIQVIASGAILVTNGTCEYDDTRSSKKKSLQVVIFHVCHDICQMRYVLVRLEQTMLSETDLYIFALTSWHPSRMICLIGLNNIRIKEPTKKRKWMRGCVYSRLERHESDRLFLRNPEWPNLVPSHQEKLKYFLQKCPQLRWSQVDSLWTYEFFIRKRIRISFSFCWHESNCWIDRAYLEYQ